MKKGCAEEYDSSKEFGFITGENKEDQFVHISGLREHLKKKGLFLGQQVSFDIDFGMEGDKVINLCAE